MFLGCAKENILAYPVKAAKIPCSIKVRHENNGVEWEQAIHKNLFKHWMFNQVCDVGVIWILHFYVVWPCSMIRQLPLRG